MTISKRVRNKSSHVLRRLRIRERSRLTTRWLLTTWISCRRGVFQKCLRRRRRVGAERSSHRRLLTPCRARSRGQGLHPRCCRVSSKMLPTAATLEEDEEGPRWSIPWPEGLVRPEGLQIEGRSLAAASTRGVLLLSRRFARRRPGELREQGRNGRAGSKYPQQPGYRLRGYAFHILPRHADRTHSAPAIR